MILFQACRPTFKFSNDRERFSVCQCAPYMLDQVNPLVQVDHDGSIELARALTEKKGSCDIIIKIEASNDIDISCEPLCEVFRAAALRKAHVREWLRVSVMPNMGQVAAAKTMLELLKSKNSMTQFRAAAHVGHQRHCTARA